MNGSLLALAAVNLSLGGLAFLLGMLILRENARQRLNRVVAFMLFFAGFGSLLAGAGFLGTTQDAGARGAAINPVQSLAYLWEFFFPTLFLFACLYPNERRFTRKPRVFARLPWWPSFELLVMLPHAVHFIVLLAIAIATPGIETLGGGVLRAFSAFISLFGLFTDLFLVVHQSLFSVVNLGFGIGAVVLLLQSWQKARAPRVRQQLGAITLGLSTCLALYAMGAIIPTLFGLRLSAMMSASLTAAALTVGSGAIAYAIVRHKFLDVRLLARRGILYGLATALVIGVYLVVVGQARELVTEFAHLPPSVVEPVFLIVALIVFQPILGRLEDALDRLFLGDPSDYRNVLRQLGRDVLGTLELEALLSRTVTTIADAMTLRRATMVAFVHDRLVCRSTTGEEPAPASLEHCRAALRAVPAESETIRLGEESDGLDDADRDGLMNAMGAVLLVPLRVRGEVVGALLLGAKETGTGFTSEDVNLLSSLAGQLAVSLQNALLVRDREQAVRLGEELRLAQQIQLSFLRTEFPPLPRFDVHATSIPSKEVGGDLYDLVPVGEREFVVAIADVAGKGVPAALLSSMLLASLRTQAASIVSTAEMLRNLNALVYRGATVHQFATAFLARIHCDGPGLTFSNAGHNYPVVLSRDGGHRTLVRGGTVLGILERVGFEEERVMLATGDRLVLYTDGITEAESEDRELFGEERLYALLRELPDDLTAREITERILLGVRSFIGAGEPRDDMTLMVLRVLEPEAAPAGKGGSIATEATVAG